MTDRTYPGGDVDNDPEELGGCQDCGRLLERGSYGYDDIVSAPYVTESGDLYCIPCGRGHDAAQRAQAEEDGFDFGDGDDGDAWDKAARERQDETGAFNPAPQKDAT